MDSIIEELDEIRREMLFREATTNRSEEESNMLLARNAFYDAIDRHEESYLMRKAWDSNSIRRLELMQGEALIKVSGTYFEGSTEFIKIITDLNESNRRAEGRYTFKAFPSSWKRFEFS